MPDLKEELKGRAYKRFIHEALKRSDMFSFTLRMDFVNSVLSSPEFYPRLDEESKKRWDQMIIENKQRKEIFHTKCMSFVEEFSPYLLKKISRNYWPNTRVTWSGRKNITLPEVYFFRSEQRLESLLIAPKRLYAWKYPYYPDDLCFYREGKCWFSITAHEQYSYLWADSTDDIHFWKTLGLKFRRCYNPKYENENHRWDENNIDSDKWFGCPVGPM